jgi:UDP-N-acetylglucosamine 3-dehydrogenase
MNSKGAASGVKAEARRSLRIGVIGAGVMGSNHARVLSGLPDITLVGVVDPLQAQRNRATELTN